MSVLFYDIHKELNYKICDKVQECGSFWELLYADDTLLIGNRARELNMLLHALEKECAKYNMRLNKAKCLYIGMGGAADIHFQDGTKIQRVDKAGYLGGVIAEDANRNNEINARLGKAMSTCHKLKIFWRKTNAPKTWKLQVFNAIIISQLTYGLNSLSLTPGCINRLNAFHIKGLRQIMGIPHAYYSGVSNEQVLKRVNLALNKADTLDLTWEQFHTDAQQRKKKFKTTTLVGQLVQDRQVNMLGHVLRRDMDHLLRKVTCDEELQRPHKGFKRVGRPKHNWVEDNLARAHLHIGEVTMGPDGPIYTGNPQVTTYDPDNPVHVQNLKEAANNRRF